MTTLKDRPNRALLVVDAQCGPLLSAVKSDAVINNIARLVERARAAKVPVIWVQHHDEHMPRHSPAWALVPQLSPLPGEPLVEKEYGDAWEETSLEQVLADAGVGGVVVVGAQTDQCVRSTLHGALVRGYDTTLVSDAHTTEDLSAYGAPPPELVIAHTNLYWTYQKAPGREVGTCATDDVEFSTDRGAGRNGLVMRSPME